MVLTLPQNQLYFLSLIVIPIHLISFTIAQHIMKRDFHKLVETGYNRRDPSNGRIGDTYLSEYYDDFGSTKEFRHVLVRRSSVLPSPLRSWCSLLPKSSTPYVPIQCEVSGDLPICENECNAYHHCWKQLPSVKRCCPPGRHFDHRKRKCRSIAKARCNTSNNNTTPPENHFYVNTATNGSPMNMPFWPPFFPGIISGPFWYPSFSNSFMPQPALYSYAPVPMVMPMPMYMGAPFYPPMSPYQTQGYPTGKMVAFPPGLPEGNQLNPSGEAQAGISMGNSNTVPQSSAPVQVTLDLQGKMPSEVESGEVETRPSLMKGIDLFPTFHENNVAKWLQKRAKLL